MTNVNDLPVAVNDSFDVDEDSVLALLDVLANDVDADIGDTKQIIQVGVIQPPTNGSVFISSNNTNNQIQYTPLADYVGADNFSYVMEDGAGENSTAYVSITINNVNDPPQVVDDAYLVFQDSGWNLLDNPDVPEANDIDIDGDVLTVIAASDLSSPTIRVSVGNRNRSRERGRICNPQHSSLTLRVTFPASRPEFRSSTEY